MAKKPTIEEIQKYLDTYNPFGLAHATISQVREHNHLIYRVSRYDKDFCLRMINPESYRRREWISMSDEYILLKRLEPSGLGPRAHFADTRRFAIPLIIEEFVTRVDAFSALKPLQEEHIIAAAKAIALLNSRDISPANFPFRRGKARRRDSYGRSVWVWRYRLLYALARSRFEKDVSVWFWILMDAVNRAGKILKRYEPLLRGVRPSFHFDGAHCGNTYRRRADGRVMFLDWESVSWRQDPAFTAARFLVSTATAGQKIPQEYKEAFISTYLAERPIPRFAEFLEIRLFEREVADLVWVLWNYVRQGVAGRSVSRATGIEKRYQAVLQLLGQYEGRR